MTRYLFAVILIFPCRNALAAAVTKDDMSVAASVSASNGQKSVLSPEGSLLSKVDSWAEKLIGLVPSEKARCVAGEVRDLVRPAQYSSADVGGSNQGLVSRNQDMMDSNPCFARLAQNFWGEIENQFPRASREIKITKPNLTEKVGEGRFAQLEPGWLWKKAMSATGGNTNLAMDLLAVCMHDDTAQNLKGRFSAADSAEKRKEALKSVDQKIAEMKDRMKGLEPNSNEFRLLENYLDELSFVQKKILKNLELKASVVGSLFDCPNSSSPVFAQKSVDESMIVPAELVEDIRKAQRPDGFAETLPAKAYHFMGGASVGCALSRCGVSPEQSAFIAGQLANAYRAMRVCPHVKKALQQRDLVAAQLDLNPNDPSFPAKATELLTENFIKFIPPQDGNRGENAPAIKSIGKLFLPMGKEYIDDAYKKQVAKTVKEMERATLFSKLFLGGPNSPFPCTALRGGPEDLMEQDKTFEREPHQAKPAGGSICGIVGWSVERCAAARKSLAEWDVDFKWTKTQHEIGAKFGATKCRSSSQGLSERLRPDKVLCPQGGNEYVPPKGEIQELKIPEATKFNNLETHQ